MRRRPLLLALPGLAAFAHRAAQARGPQIEVWKDPHCGCCADWIAHLESAGFVVRTHATGNTAARRHLGMPARYASCHTARVDGYVIEGHVPASEIRRLLAERPADALGLAVPGMPVGSPGMDGPAYGGRRDPHDVLLVLRNGLSRVYRSYFRG
jgi:hypothetical protein